MMLEQQAPYLQQSVQSEPGLTSKIGAITARLAAVLN